RKYSRTPRKNRLPRWRHAIRSESERFAATSGSDPADRGDSVMSSTGASRQFPARAILFFQNRFGVGQPFRLHVRGVPVDSFAQAERRDTEQRQFGQLGAIGELRPGRFTTFAGVEPVAVMTIRPRQRRFRTLELVAAFAEQS